jgi:hypothetical protein
MRRIRIRRKPNRKIRIRRNAARDRVLAVLARMRNRGESLSKAARGAHTSPRTVLKHACRQLKPGTSGQYSATHDDTIRRDLYVFGFNGYMPVTVRSSKQARLASEHLIAVNRFLRTGDTEWLKRFRGKRFGEIELLTDPERIREFAEADLVKLDGLYRNHRGAGEGR